MDIKNKLRYAKTWVDAIARHESVDAVVRNAALDEVEKHITAARAEMAERLKAKVAEFATAAPASTDAAEPTVN